MLKLQGIMHHFDRTPVLRNIHLEVAQGEIFSLLGPSGCGKTTLLRTVAGLITPDEGMITYDGDALQHTPVHERGFGFMFQDFALFPHLNVADNVAFGLKMHGHTGQSVRVQEVLALVGLQGFGPRDVTQLSGGEKQRVALARSLALEPKLLMLDEPLGSLDAALRAQLVVELRKIIQSVGLTALYVTHDQQEAFAIADRVGIMNAGRLEQVGTPEYVYRQPKTAFVARFLGLNNIVPVRDYQSEHAMTALGTFAVDRKSAALLIHPVSIRLSTPEHDGMSVTVMVVERTFQGDSYQLVVKHASEIKLEFKIPADIENLPEVGDQAEIRLNPRYVVPLD